MKMRKARKTIGIVLLIALLIPVLILCRPATRTEMIVSKAQGLFGLTSVEFIEHTYIPLFDVAKMWVSCPWSPADAALILTYFGLYALAFFLIRFKTKREREPDIVDPHIFRGA